MDRTIITGEMLENVKAFHGHWCPGLAIGIRASEMALARLGHSSDEDIVALAETDFCGVDAVQYLTGCTLGKGNLVIKEYGKAAFSFYRRSDEKSFRIILETSENLSKEIDGYADIGHHEKAAQILKVPLDKLFRIKDTNEPEPPYAFLDSNVTCSECGEPFMETKARLYRGQILCIPCFERVMQHR